MSETPNSTNAPISSADDASEDVGDTPFGVQVSFPEIVTIRMVDASALGDYEFSILIAGFCCNAAVGFAVAAATIPSMFEVLGVVTGLFTVLTIAFAGWALSKRGSLKRRERIVKIRGGKGRAFPAPNADSVL